MPGAQRVHGDHVASTSLRKGHFPTGGPGVKASGILKQSSWPGISRLNASELSDVQKGVNLENARICSNATDDNMNLAAVRQVNDKIHSVCRMWPNWWPVDNAAHVNLRQSFGSCAANWCLLSSISEVYKYYYISAPAVRGSFRLSSEP